MKLKNAKGNVKIIFCLVIVILIIIIGIIVLKNTKKEDDVQLNKQEPYEYFNLFSADGTVGVIDKTGKILVKSEYTEIYIPNQSKDVFFCFKNEEYTVLNKEGKDIFKNFENVSPITISDTTLEMEKEVLSYSENGKYGLVDYSGKKLTEPIYDEVTSLPNKPGFILVKKDNLYGVLDSKGKVIIEEKYNSIKGDEYCSEVDNYMKTGYIISEKTDTGIIYGYVNYKGKMLIEPKYESITRALEYDNEDIYLIVMENGKKGVIKNKKVIVKPKYQSINYYNVSKIFIVNRNGKYGFFDINGSQILDVEYESYTVAGNYISVSKDNNMRLYDLHGNLVNTNTYKSIQETGNPSYFIAQDENGYFSIISKDVQIDNKYTNISYAFDNFFIFTNEEGLTGLLNVYTGIEIQPTYEYIIVLENAKALEARKLDEVDIYSENIEKVLSMKNGVVESVSDKYTAIYSNTDLKYIDNTGKIVENTEVYKDLKLYSYKSDDGKWGFKDVSGKIVVDCKYDMVTELNEYGFAGIYQEGKWGVIDSSGKVIVVPTYEIQTYYSPKFIDKYLIESLDNVHVVEVKNGEK